MKTTVPITSKATLSDLARDGYVHVGCAAVPKDVEGFLTQVGHILSVTEVRPVANSKSLVNSDRALKLHTDHHRASVIAWHCVHQSSSGGDSLLVDARKVFNCMSQEDRLALSQVSMFEHRVFPDDPDSHPIATNLQHSPRIYFSFWFADRVRDSPQFPSLQRFMDALVNEKPISLRLQPGELLLVDNHRMVHGRSHIPDRRRHLRRYWIELEGD